MLFVGREGTLVNYTYTLGRVRRSPSPQKIVSGATERHGNSMETNHSLPENCSSSNRFLHLKIQLLESHCSSVESRISGTESLPEITGTAGYSNEIQSNGNSDFGNHILVVFLEPNQSDIFSTHIAALTTRPTRLYGKLEYINNFVRNLHVRMNYMRA